MALAKIKHETILKTMECGTCGVVHAIPETLYDSCYEYGGFWHCPIGHRRGWNEGEQERERKSLQRKLEKSEQEKQRAIKQKEWAEQETENQRRSASAYKGQVTKLKNRAKAGVCPCCQRTFKQLAAHMKNMHPDFSVEPDES